MTPFSPHLTHTAPSPHRRINASSLLLAFAHIQGEAGTPTGGVGSAVVVQVFTRGMEEWKFSTRGMYVNQRRVGKKKPPNPRPRQTSTKAKRNEERRVESKINKQPHQRRKNMRLKHKRRTSLEIDQRQVCKIHAKQPRTTGNRTLAVPYISTSHLNTKHILNTRRLDERIPQCEYKRREWR
jgi:hypothetical protein